MIFNKEKTSFVIILVMALGITLRFWAYFLNTQFSVDEIALYSNFINNPISHLLGPLNGLQMAPVLFLLLSKVFIPFKENSEYLARLTPFIFSLLNLFLFYFLAKKIFIKKISIIFALFLMAINFQLIFYSQFFKQYQSDVFVCLAIVLLSFYFDFKKINTKKVILFGISTFTFFLFSNIAIFIIPAMLLNIFLKSKNSNERRNILICFTSFFIPFFIYYFLHLRNDGNITLMSEYWQNDFLSFNIKNSLRLAYKNSIFFFSGINYFSLFLIYIISFLLIIKTKKNIFTLLIVALCAIASFLHFYPYSERLILFLVPVFIILLAYPLEFIDLKNKKTLALFISVFYIISFIHYFFVALKNDLNKDSYVVNNWPHYFSTISNLQSRGDFIVVDQILWNSYKFYRKKFNPEISDFDMNYKILNEIEANQQIEYIKQMHNYTNIWILAIDSETLLKVVNKLGVGERDYICEKKDAAYFCNIPKKGPKINSTPKS